MGLDLGSIGSCSGGVHCGCPNCVITWTICAQDPCTPGSGVSGATVTVKDSEGTTVTTCTTGSCSVCPLPATDLTVTWANTNASYSGTATLVYDSGTGIYESACINYGTNRSIKIRVQCVSGSPVLTVYSTVTSSSCASPDEFSSDNGDFSSPTLRCGPLFMSWNIPSPVELRSSRGFTNFTITQPGNPGGGCCTVTIPAAGNYTAEIAKTGFATATVSLTAECGNAYTTTVKLLPATRSFSQCITVRDLCTDEVIPGATVTITGGGSASGTTDSSGQFCFTPTQSDTITVTISYPPCWKTYTGSANPCTQSIAGTVYLELSDDYVCFCGCPTPRTLTLTDSGGTISALYGTATSGAGWKWCGTINSSARVHITSGECLDEQECTYVDEAGCRVTTQFIPPSFTTQSLWCIYELTCEGSPPEPTLKCQVLSGITVASYNSAGAGAPCCPRDTDEAFFCTVEECLPENVECDNPLGCGYSEFIYNGFTRDCTCGDFSLMFTFTGGSWIGAYLSNPGGIPPSTTVVITGP